MIESITGALSDAPLWLWQIAFIGGVIFALVFNIPARRRLLDHASQDRKIALRYDSMNFLVFYITYIAATSVLFWMETGHPEHLIVNTASFVVYSTGFWIMLKGYLYFRERKDKEG